MKIHEVHILSQNLDAQEDFYSNILGMECVRTSASELQVITKESRLILKSNDGNGFNYHFAFLISSGSLEDAIRYLKSRSITLLPYQDKEIIHFDHGRAIYFYDADGNIAEFIERPLVDYPKSETFSIKDIIRINEIGNPAMDTLKTAQLLMDTFGIKRLTDSLFDENFCWVGDHEGVILVPKIGRHWLPTELHAMHNPFLVRYSEDGVEYTYATEDWLM